MRSNTSALNARLRQRAQLALHFHSEPGLGSVDEEAAALSTASRSMAEQWVL